MNASDVGGRRIGSGAKANPDRFGLEAAKGWEKGAGAHGNIRNNLGVDGAVETGVFSGGACDAEAVGALENVGVIVANGGGDRSGGEAIAFSKCCHILRQVF